MHNLNAALHRPSDTETETEINYWNTQTNNTVTAYNVIHTRFWCWWRKKWKTHQKLKSKKILRKNCIRKPSTSFGMDKPPNTFCILPSKYVAVQCAELLTKSHWSRSQICCFVRLHGLLFCCIKVYITSMRFMYKF